MLDWNEMFENIEGLKDLFDACMEVDELEDENGTSSARMDLEKFGLLIDGLMSLNENPDADYVTPQMEARNILKKDVAKAKKEKMASYMTPEGWAKLTAAMDDMRKILGYEKLTDLKGRIKVTDYVGHAVFGDEDASFALTLPQTVIFDKETCEKLVEFDKKYHTSIMINGYKNQTILRFYLPLKNSIVYAK